MPQDLLGINCIIRLGCMAPASYNCPPPKHCIIPEDKVYKQMPSEARGNSRTVSLLHETSVWVCPQPIRSATESCFPDLSHDCSSAGIRCVFYLFILCEQHVRAPVPVRLSDFSAVNVILAFPYGFWNIPERLCNLTYILWSFGSFYLHTFFCSFLYLKNWPAP